MSTLEAMLRRLPAYPEMRPLEVTDRAEVEAILAPEEPEGSELTFTNLFIWRDYYRLKAGLFGGRCLVLAADPPDKPPFFLPPVGDGAGDAARELLSKGGRIARATRGWLEHHGLWEGASGIGRTEQRDQADYVYETSDLISLSGRRFAGKRNHVKQFMRSYRWEYRPLTADLVPACLELEEKWCEVRACPVEIALAAEQAAIEEALRNFGALGYVGGVILVEGKVEAFSIGERLNAECSVIHIEKANPEVTGIYQVINQQFLEQALKQYRFVNREQDLGDEGLRRAKESYHPHHLVAKFLLGRQARTGHGVCKL